MPEQKNSSLEKFYNDIATRMIEDCSLCGTCMDVCPIFPMTELKDANIMESVVDFLKDGTYSEEVYLKAYSCAGCGYCSDCCPQDLDPMLIHEALKVKLIHHGIDPPEGFEYVAPGQKFNIHRILSALQTKPSERRWLEHIPPNPEKVENVVFLGCFGTALPHSIYALLDTLEGIGLEFVTLSGGELCCGTTLCPGAGRAKESEEKARELVNGLKAFSPKRIILTCTGCFRQLTELFPAFIDLEFEVIYYTQVLEENLEKLKFVKPLNKTITIHESCTTRRINISDSVMKILGAIPGIKIVNNDDQDKQAYCCGGVANTTYPPMAQKLGQALLEEIMGINADYITMTCPFCRLTFYPYARQHSLNISDIATLINESMGGRAYEDKLEEYWQCEKVEEIIEKSRENFEANGYREEEMRKILPMLFPFAAP